MFEKAACWITNNVATAWASLAWAVLLAGGYVFLERDNFNVWISIVTFAMTIAILNDQNRATASLHTKMDALIIASPARNEIAKVDELTSEEIRDVREHLADEEQPPQPVELQSGPSGYPWLWWGLRR